eukprot:1311456-Rhodomonas_salina.2
MAVYKRYQAYYAGKMSQRRVGGRWWRVAYYRWRRYSWRGYKWYSWYIRLLRRRRRYLKRFPDEYKKVSAQIVQLQKDRSAWYAAYKGAVSAWVTKLQAARGSGRCAPLLPRLGLDLRHPLAAFGHALLCVGGWR